MGDQPRFVGEQEVLGLGYAAAIRAIEAGLRAGTDPTADPARSTVDREADAFLLLMPSRAGGDLGVKLITSDPRNPGHGLPLIHGIYVLFDRDSLAPAAVLDGTALTTLRTPAVSMAAARPALRRFADPLRVVIFGIGPQAVGHLDALIDLASDDDAIPAPGKVLFVTRSDAGDRLPDRAGVDLRGATAEAPVVSDELRAADVVICASSASDPLFDSDLLSDRAVVIAIGTSRPDAAEVDRAWCARATVIVEDPETALRECGEIVQAVEAGELSAADLVPMADVVTGRRSVDSGPVLFKGSGMAWQDLLVARAVIARAVIA